MWQTHELAIKIVAKKKSEHATTVRKQPNFVIPLRQHERSGRRWCDINYY